MYGLFSSNSSNLVILVQVNDRSIYQFPWIGPRYIPSKWWFQRFCMFTPDFLGVSFTIHGSNLTKIFFVSDRGGFKQPPTRSLKMNLIPSMPSWPWVENQISLGAKPTGFPGKNGKFGAIHDGEKKCMVFMPGVPSL